MNKYNSYFILYVKIPIRLAVIAKTAIAAKSSYWHPHIKGVGRKPQQQVLIASNGAGGDL